MQCGGIILVWNDVRDLHMLNIYYLPASLIGGASIKGSPVGLNLFL